MASDKFVMRHIGPRDQEIQEMLETIGVSSLDELMNETVPENIRLKKPLNLEDGLTERQYFRKILALASKNKVYNTYIAMGYYDTITPAVILRNVLENPVWYTSYTPYQAEISQGRLEALLNFQTMVCDLTGMELANAGLLDELVERLEIVVREQREAAGRQVIQQAERAFENALAIDISVQAIAALKLRHDHIAGRVIDRDQLAKRLVGLPKRR